MPEDELHPLARTHAIVDRRPDQFVNYFYTHLFWSHPELRCLFPEDTRPQWERFAVALERIVGQSHHTDLHEFLQKLGGDHRTYAVEAAHYPAVGDSLIAALRHTCGTAWDAEAEAVWKQAYAAVAEVMINAGKYTEEHPEAPWWHATISGIRRTAADVAVITVRSERPFPYRAGQHAAVLSPRLPGVGGAYALASAPGDGFTLTLHVAAAPQARLSAALVRSSRVGDRLRLGPAVGAMTLPPVLSRPLAFIAADLGWAPVRALLEELAERPGPPPARVVVAVSGREQFYDLDAFRRLERRCRNAEFTLCTAPTTGLLYQRVHRQLSLTPGWDRHHVLLSGTSAFTDCVRGALRAQGTPPALISSSIPLDDVG